MSGNTERAFFELVKSGLFSHTKNTDSTEEFSWKGVDWVEVYRLAEEQSVIGLVSAGLDWFRVNDSRFTVPQTIALQFIGQTLQIEQRNKAMNAFVAELIMKLRKADIYAILVKGQGIAQSYEKPLWRACGDVDLFLSDENYQKAKELLLPLGEITEPEERAKKHFAMNIDGFAVELHGTLHCGLSARMDRTLDEIQNDTFYGGSVSSWNNGGVQVFKLNKENEVFYVFAHFLGHFYKGGIGLRQICDWCRLLYTYRESLDYGLLESRIREAGLMSEWRAFGTLAIEYLGLPIEVMPLLNVNANLNLNEVVTQKSQITQKGLDANLERKAERIMKFILKVGNFGHNRDMSFYREGSYLGQKVKSFGRRMGDLWNHLMIFPMDTLRFFPRIVINGLRSAANGE